MLGQYLAGEFDNREQALADPTWFVHLRVWYRPARLFVADSLTFFLEQVSVAASQPPYRQRVLRLQQHNGTLIGQFYGLQDPGKFRGSAANPTQLATLSEADLVELPTCRLAITQEPLAHGQSAFRGMLPPNTLCSFEYGGKTGYVSLGFAIAPAADKADTLALQVYDKGVDPVTGKGLWGALMGPFYLCKVVDFKDELVN